MTKPRNAPTAERPLSARSVVLSTLLGMRPPRLPTRILVASGVLFGIAEGTTRVALSRMVSAGELEPEGDGYALAGRLLTRQARQAVSRRGPSETWDGGWRMEVVVGAARPAAERTALRGAAVALRLAELRAGVWLRPDNLPAGELPDAEAVLAEQCEGLTSRPRTEAAALAGRLWDLDAWAAEAGALRAELGRVVGHLERERLSALPDGFLLSAAVLRHLQADALLPAELLPRRWPGGALRADYDRYDLAFKALWRTWYRSQH